MSLKNFKMHRMAKTNPSGPDCVEVALGAIMMKWLTTNGSNESKGKHDSKVCYQDR